MDPNKYYKHDKILGNYYNKQKYNYDYNDSDDDDDYEIEADDPNYTSSDYSGNLIPNYQKSSNMYGKNNQPTAYRSGMGDMYSNTGGLGKYDVNNPGYRMTSVNMANEKGMGKYSSTMDKKKPPSKISTDPYNLGGYSMSNMGTYGIGSMGGYGGSAIKDSYNIDIDISKFNNENNSNEGKFSSISKPKIDSKLGNTNSSNQEKMNNEKDIEKPKEKKKKKRDFLDDLENQLNKEKQKEEEEAIELGEHIELEDHDENKFDYENFHRTLKEDDSEDLKDDNNIINELDSKISKTSEKYEKHKTENKNKFNNQNYDNYDNDESDKKNKDDDNKDSTISIDRFLKNNDKQQEANSIHSKKISDDKNKSSFISEDEDNYSYNKFTTSNRDPPNINKNAVYDVRKMEEYLKNNQIAPNINSGINVINEKKSDSNSSNSSNKKESIQDKKSKKLSDIKNNNENQPPLHTISDNDNKYDDFENNSKLIHNTDNDQEGYSKFDNDINSNLGESNNDLPIQNLAKSSLSNHDIKNILSSSDEVFSKNKSIQIPDKIESDKKSDEYKLKIKPVDDNTNNQLTIHGIKPNQDGEETNKNKIKKNFIKENVDNTSKSNQFEINYNQEYIQNIIVDEFKKLLNSNGSPSDLLKMSIGSPNNNLLNTFSSNPTNLKPASQEIQERLKSFIIDKSNNFLIYSDSHNKLKKFDWKKTIPYTSEELYIPRTIIAKKDIKELKLQAALEEERKRREFFELNYNRLKETNEDMESKLRKLRRTEIENSELKKSNFETEQKYKELEADLLNLKNDYEIKIKLVEERVVLRESKNETKKIAEMERKYQIEIANLTNELREKEVDLADYKNKFEYFEKENTKLSINKISNLETNDKIKEMRTENFVLHEKCNELVVKYERLYAEKEKLEKKLFEKDIESEKDITINNKENLTGTNFKNNQNSKFGSVKLNMSGTGFLNVQQNISSNKNDQFSIFDQIMLEREQNVQESIIKSYSNEIERLNNEIKLLKAIAGNTSSNVNRETKTKIHSSELIHNNYKEANLNRATNMSKNLQHNMENNFVKDSAEEKIKLLQKIFSDSNQNNITLAQLENEFLLHDQLVNISESPGEIDVDSFLRIFLNKMKIPLSKYELIEIYNNFPRTQQGRIRMNEVLNALRSRNPSTFFIQPDPSYLRDLESKLIINQKKFEEMENIVDSLEKKEKEIKEKYVLLETENKQLREKIKSNKETSISNENLLGSLMRNNFLSNPSVDPNIKILKDKIKSLEKTNLSNLNEFEKKIETYENKFNNLTKNLEDKEKSGNNINVISNELISVNKQLLSIKEENAQLKSKISENDIIKKNDILKYQEKLAKYKKNYQTLKEKLDKSDKDKERIIASLQNKNLNLNPSVIQNFILNSEEIENLNNKIVELEKRNKDREEHYKQLCYNVNSHQINKEIDNLSKKFDVERKEYIKVINQKNNEFLVVKKEFEEIYRELEEIKYTKK